MKYRRFELLGPGPNGEARHLRFDINAVCAIEEGLGDSIYSALKKGGINTIRYMLWGGLKWEDAALTPKKVGELIQQYAVDGPQDLTERLVEETVEALKESGVIGTVPAPKVPEPPPDAPLKQQTAEPMEGERHSDDG